MVRSAFVWIHCQKMSRQLDSSRFSDGKDFLVTKRAIIDNSHCSDHSWKTPVQGDKCDDHMDVGVRRTQDAKAEFA